MDPEDLHPDANVMRHTERIESEYESEGDGRLIEAVSDHFERYVGPVYKVFHEIQSDRVHIDVHIIRADEHRPYQVLFTTGMAELPMTVPEGLAAYRFAEVMIKLPADWPLGLQEEGRKGSAAENERWYWPIRLLKHFARLPHDYGTYVMHGHSMPNGDPPEPFADDSTMHGALLVSPLIDDDAFGEIEVDEDRTVHIWQIMPMGPGEMEHKLANGTNSLLELYDTMRVSDVVDTNRLDVTGQRPRRKRFFGFF